jgi:cell division transport system ATP-binding protein
VIRLSRLCKAYSDGRHALVDVSFEVTSGEMVLLTGASGSGKSALIRILAGADAPTDGQGIVNGRNLARLDSTALARFRRETGVVFQDCRLIERSSVLDNVALAAEVVGDPYPRARARAEEALEMVGLVADAERPACALSAGDRRRVCLARALVHRPSLLLADEPTGDLDPDASERVVALLERLHRGGTTIFVASHDEEALALLDCRTLMMYRGRVFEEDDARLASSQ